MPITQSRMLSLIHAAQDYQKALQRLCQEINLQSQLYPKDPQLSYLAALAIEASLLDSPTESPKAIALEAVHFSRVWKRNNRTAIKQAQRRGRSIATRVYLHLPNLLEQEKHFQSEALTPEQKALIEAEAAAMQQQEKEEEFTIE